MSDTNKFLVPTEPVAQSFKTHLSLKNNKRVLFSAPFGAGKSYFLNTYFDANDEQLALTIHPVDYAVSSNEDIFELIKYDILTAMIDKFFDELNLQDEEIPDLLLAQEYARNRLEFYPIVKEVLALLLPNGDKIKTVLDLLEKEADKFGAYKDEMNQGEEHEVVQYLVSHRMKKGSVRENGDYITALIKSFVKRIKEKHGDKRLVLVLDDLDRLDPEHVFRLFNVFTAHHDSKTDRNKFDLDQVIFVCDVRNIHYMFQHKYGQHTDFQGYIDKFYSSHIFQFDFKKYIKEHINTLLSARYHFEAQYKDGAVERTLCDRYDFKKTRSDFNLILEYILGNMVDLDLVRMRNFERFNGFQLPNYAFDLAYGRKDHAAQYPFLVLIFTIQQFFPRWYELKAALQTCCESFQADYTHSSKSHTYDDDGVINALIEMALPFLTNLRIAFLNRNDEGEHRFDTVNENNIKISINYNATREGRYKYHGNMRIADLISIGGNCIRPNPYWFLLKALESSEHNGFLRPQ